MIIEKGSFVRLKNGHTPILITDKYLRGGFTRVDGVYAFGEYPITNRTTADFVLWDGSNNEINPTHWQDCVGFEPIEHAKQKEPVMALYQTTEEKPRFGTKLATNSENQIVLEMKGEGGKVEAFAADSVKEVVPYTFTARAATSGAKQSFLGIAEEVKLHDMLIGSGGAIYTVSDIDTKDRHATKAFKGNIIVTRALSPIKSG